MYNYVNTEYGKVMCIQLIVYSETCIHKCLLTAGIFLYVINVMVNYKEHSLHQTLL